MMYVARRFWCSLFDVRCVLYEVVCCLLFGVCRLPVVVSCGLWVVSLLRDVCCLMSVDCCAVFEIWLATMRRALFAACVLR